MKILKKLRKTINRNVDNSKSELETNEEPRKNRKPIFWGKSWAKVFLKLKLQYFGQVMWRADSLEKTSCWKRLKAKEEGASKAWDVLITSPTQWMWIWVISGRQRSLMCHSPRGCQSLTCHSNWTTNNIDNK